MDHKNVRSSFIYNHNVAQINISCRACLLVWTWKRILGDTQTVLVQLLWRCAIVGWRLSWKYLLFCILMLMMWQADWADWADWAGMSFTLQILWAGEIFGHGAWPGPPPAPASHISIVSGIIIKFQITSYQARCQQVKSLPLNVGTETRGVSY